VVSPKNYKVTDKDNKQETGSKYTAAVESISFDNINFDSPQAILHTL
jgi:hypothetical protein